MNKIYLDEKTTPGKPLVATIGFFDGVHRGHQFLIKQVCDEAKASGMESAVITFDEHPRKVLHQDYQPRLLSTLEEKLILLSRTGIDNAVVLHFDREMAGLSAHDFMEKVLHDRLNVKKLIIGYDNRFGHNRAEGFDDYVRMGHEMGIEVIQSQAFSLDGVNVSSSYIRKLIEKGELELANKCLGYPYAIYGKVVSGYQEGRKLGFPTANLDLSGSGQLVPANGVYGVKVRLQDSMQYRRGMMNIGTRPTFNGKNLSIEAYIFDFSGDIYGQTLVAAFIHRIRDEHKFDSAEELAEQMRNDAKIIEEQFDKESEDEE
jgi:riboflavin kinase/FMN adenylyltransferase